MKLRNKKTGEIAYMSGLGVDGANGSEKEYHSLAELNEEWEDYKEPEGWCVTMYGGITRTTKNDEILFPDLKEIGNWFIDKESAYDALEKLKAWKRLKDKGFKFKWWVRTTDNFGDTIEITATSPTMTCSEDLDFLFGGKE